MSTTSRNRAAANDPVSQKLERARQELLDVSLRGNTLINYRTLTGRGVEVVGEGSDDVFNLLVRERKAMGFKPIDPDSDYDEASWVEGNGAPDGEYLADLWLQTRESDDRLAHRLLQSFYIARTSLEEQGVSVLFLALGMLRWYEAQATDQPRLAPLILVPVELERRDALDRFQVRYTEEDIGENLSLRAKLKLEFNVDAPQFQSETEDFDVDAYFDEFDAAIGSQSRWSIERNYIALGFFSFGKFLMYRDLDPSGWAEGLQSDSHELVGQLLGDGFTGDPSQYSDDTFIDAVIGPHELRQVVDADSSQTLAILDVRSGHNLVIQGPPGTGKSQTITNIIAEAIGMGQKVLFVAEKMAALDVVKRRLDDVGLGAACLELHSHKINKRSVLEELRRTLNGSQLASNRANYELRQLTADRDDLNAYCNAVNSPLDGTDTSPFESMGNQLLMPESAPDAVWPPIPEASLSTMAREDFEHRATVILGLQSAVATLGIPHEHPFWGIQLEIVLPSDIDSLRRSLNALEQSLSNLRELGADIAHDLTLIAPPSAARLAALIPTAEAVINAPSCEGMSFSNVAWRERAAEISAALVLGEALASLRTSRGARAIDAVCARDCRTQLMDALTSVQELKRLSAEMQQIFAAKPADSVDAIIFLGTSLQRALDAPKAQGINYADSQWEASSETLASVFASGRSLAELRNRFGGAIRWDKDIPDLSEERSDLLTYGSKWWKFFSGRYRKARTTIADFYIGDLPDGLQEQLAVLDRLIEAYEHRARLSAHNDLGSRLFGAGWQGEQSNWELLSECTNWAVAAHRDVAAGLLTPAIFGVAGNNSLRPRMVAVVERAKWASAAYQECALNLDRAVGADVLMFSSVGSTKSLATQEQVLSDLMRAHDTSQELEPLRSLLAELFGSAWRDLDSDWSRLTPYAAELAGLHDAVNRGKLPREALLALDGGVDRDRLAALVSTASAQVREHAVQAERLSQVLEYDCKQRFPHVQTIAALTFQEQHSLFSLWIANLSRLHEMTSFNIAALACREMKMPEVVEAGIDWPAAGEHLVQAWRWNRHRALLDRAFRERPVLNRFSVENHEQLVDRFRQLDRLTFRHNQLALAHEHWQRLPRQEGGGQLRVLRREMEKKARHRPIRWLIQEAGAAIQAIKPVFMMSPMSVATFVPPGALEFDLVIFDEASQVKPVDAFGALLRGEQAVVVGDSKQLPPTSFFETLTHGEELDEEESATSDIESILGMMRAANAPQRMLRWHYRSQHESLIAVSNHEFYEDRLVIFPSPDHSRERLGLVLYHLPDTVYGRGNTRTNPGEADAVAAAVMHHARSSPDRTLGVAAFSQPQAEAIITSVEALRHEDPSCEAFFNGHPREPFFVKSLENVQGDERDVIYISIGYGRDDSGKVSMNFGPLNGNGGERRLNVLITRAKRRCEVFTNLTADDIDLRRSNARGVVALKRFLHYANTKSLDVPTATGRAPDSPFEESVAAALRGAGYDVVPQVGSAGFFIDLAIIDPERPGRYLLGIECDGASYHSARSARDRDRLRQQVLEGLGWKIHRVWSTDWFRHEERELRRLANAIERAKAEGYESPEPEPASPSITDFEQPPKQVQPSGGSIRPVSSTNAEIVARMRASATGGQSRADEVPTSPKRVAVPYQLANPKLRVRVSEVHEMPMAEARRLVLEVVTVESPVHISEVVRRVARVGGAARTGNRIDETVRAATRSLTRGGQLRQRGDFLWALNMSEAVLRDRRTLPNQMRAAELIAPEELELAVATVIAFGYGMAHREAISSAARLLGYQRTGDDLRGRFDSAIDRLLDNGRLETRNGQLFVVDG